MPKPTKGPRLGGSPAHERLILGNLACALFQNEKIVTTEVRAKRVQPLAEKLITKARRGDLHARRQVLARLNNNKAVVAQLFEEIAPAIDAAREGGYTRIVKMGNRRGDNAPMAELSLVLEAVEKKKKVKTAKRPAAGKAESAEKAEETVKPAEELESNETDSAEDKVDSAQPEESQPEDAQPAVDAEKDSSVSEEDSAEDTK